MASKKKINPEIGFVDIVAKAGEFTKGEITPEEFSEWGNSLMVRTSIPILDKMSIIMTLISMKEYSGSEVAEITVCELYKNIFFYLYLEQYLGIDDISPDDATYEMYDFLDPIYGPWIESFAERDIKIFKELLKQSLEFYNIQEIDRAISLVDTEALASATQSNKDFLAQLNKDKNLIADLKELAVMNDPMTAKVVEALKTQALEEAKESDKTN